MGRDYHFSKRITKDQADEIVNEVAQLQDIKDVRITPDLGEIIVETKDNDYCDVMSRTVNICRRIANGCDISFSKFVV